MEIDYCWKSSYKVPPPHGQMYNILEPVYGKDIADMTRVLIRDRIFFIYSCHEVALQHLLERVSVSFDRVWSV